MSAGELRQLFSDLDVPLEPAVVIDQQSTSWLKNNQMKSKLSTKQLKRPCVMCKLVWIALQLVTQIYITSLCKQSFSS